MRVLEESSKCIDSIKKFTNDSICIPMSRISLNKKKKIPIEIQDHLKPLRNINKQETKDFRLKMLENNYVEADNIFSDDIELQKVKKNFLVNCKV